MAKCVLTLAKLVLFFLPFRFSLSLSSLLRLLCLPYSLMYLYESVLTYVSKIYTLQSTQQDDLVWTFDDETVIITGIPEQPE